MDNISITSSEAVCFFMIAEASPENIKRAADLLRAGELVAFPTETVYGLGADATNECAVKKIFEAKGRPSYDPLIVHVAESEQVEEFANLDDPVIKERFLALKIFWPGPLSIVVPLRDRIAPSVSAGLATVAVRIPAHPVARQLLKEVAIPIAAPSANQFSYVSPTRAEHVQDSLGDQVPLILDGGACPIGIESTVISIIGESPTLLRPGYISKEELEKIIGKVSFVNKKNQKPNSPLPAPGMLEKHYSPKTPLRLLTDLSFSDLPKRTGVITFKEGDHPKNSKIIRVKILSKNGDLKEITAALYEAIRELDKLNLDLILIDSCEPSGIGQAVMDRISRAVHK